jgi:hypothetical protein
VRTFTGADVANVRASSLRICKVTRREHQQSHLTLRYCATSPDLHRRSRLCRLTISSGSALEGSRSGRRLRGIQAGAPERCASPAAFEHIAKRFRVTYALKRITDVLAQAPVHAALRKLRICVDVFRVEAALNRSCNGSPGRACDLNVTLSGVSLTEENKAPG